jgi:hypothetical protein
VFVPARESWGTPPAGCWAPPAPRCTSGRLRAERDENICRKDFTPTEEHALDEALLELERPKAEERQRELGRNHGTLPATFAGGSGELAKLAAAGASVNRADTPLSTRSVRSRSFSKA